MRHRLRLPAWAIALVIAVVLAGWLHHLNRPLIEEEVAPQGLLSLQLAPAPAIAFDIVRRWSPEQRDRARLSLYLDFLLIFAYGFGLRGACRTAAANFSPRARRFTLRVVAPLQVAAAALDTAENVFQLAMLYGFEHGMPGLMWVSVPTALCAALKWAFVFGGVATAVAGAVARSEGLAPPVFGVRRRSESNDFRQVLHAELDALKSRASGACAFKRAQDASLAGLALSGGGIRSATVCLGVLQSLAGASLLRRFDYLSTVSGGGYIGAWLAAWAKREPGGIAGVEAALRAKGACAEQIEFLRTYSNYLTPRKGFFTVDTWAAVATYLRNLLLNLTIFVLLVWAALALILFLTSYGWENPLPLGLASMLLLWAATAIATLGVTVRVTDLRLLSGIVRWAQTPAGAAFGIVAALFAAAVTGGFWLIGWGMTRPGEAYDWAVLGVAIAIAVWVICWWAGERVNRRHGIVEAAPGQPNVLGFLVVVLLSGLLAALAIRTLAFAVAELDVNRWLTDKGPMKAAVAMTLSPAIVLGGVGLGIVFGIGLLGRDYSDKGREWWSRITGWLLALTLGWMVLVGGAFVTPGIVAWIGDQPRFSPNKIAAAAWAALTFALARLGKDNGADGLVGLGKRVLVVVGSYLVIAGFLIICGWSFFSFHAAGRDCAPPTTLEACIHENVLAWLEPGKGRALGFFVLFLLAALLLMRRIDINRFSLHDFYKNRLVRCYLGASNPGRERQLDQVSGFAAKDEIALAELAGQRPQLIVNTALNIVRGKRLAWQERQAASFVLTPLYCGFEITERRMRASFRSTSAYAGGSVTLGQAMSISGAAVNPQHGRGTTPVFMLLATLLNLRTGVWMPNSRYHIARLSPAIAGGYLLAELFGWTDEQKQYVHLSDGGHFDNLGVYELVRRRCRLIVAVDASEDAQRGFEDLASCIRRCEVDFGARIHLNVSQLIPQANLLSSAAAANGTIEYPALDEAPAFEGRIFYLKSSRIDDTDKAAALFSYGRLDARFPHHSTVDQWFDESRFESYRALGRTLGDALIARYSAELA